MYLRCIFHIVYFGVLVQVMTIRWWPCYSKSGESEGFYFAFKQEYSHHGVQITEIWKLAKSQFISMSQFRKAFSNISLWYWNSKMSLVNIRSKMIRKLLSWMCSFVSFALYFWPVYINLVKWYDTIDARKISRRCTRSLLQALF